MRSLSSGAVFGAMLEGFAGRFAVLSCLFNDATVRGGSSGF